MAHPVRARGVVTWTAPADEAQPDTWGWCLDLYLADLEAAYAGRDLREPPTPSQQLWINPGAEHDDVLLIPDLKGAIQRPRYYPMTADQVEPCEVDGTSLSWGASVWTQLVHEASRQMTAYFAPSSEPIGSGYLKTKAITDRFESGQSLVLWYQLLAATEVDGDTIPIASGLNVFLGVEPTPSGRVWHYKLALPNPHRDDSASDWWTLFRQDADENVEVVARIPSRGAIQRNDDGQPESLVIIPACGRLLVRPSRLDDWWVIKHPLGIGPRAGHVMVELYGARGWALLGMVDFADAAKVKGAVHRVPDHATWSGEVYVVRDWRRLDGPGPGEYTFDRDLIVDSEAGRLVHPEVTITNGSPTIGPAPPNHRGRLHTPILYTVQEVHHTVLAAGAGGQPLDLTSEVESLTVNWQDESYGTVATMRLRNYYEDGDAYTLGHLTDQLKGIGQITIDLAHEYPGSQPDGDLVRVMTGWLSQISFVRDGILPKIELELDDRAFLWNDGKATMMDLPDVTGWDLQAACELILLHWGVDIGDIVWVGYPAGGREIPWQGGGGAARFADETEITDALTQLCERCYFRWRLRPDGKIEFRPWREPVTEPDFVLDEATVTPEDRIIVPVAHAVEYGRTRNTIHVRGRGKAGNTIDERWTHQASIDDPDELLYLGRAVLAVRSELDNPEPVRTAIRMMYEAVEGGRTLTWNSIGRDLWPGDVVEVRCDHLAVPSGTLFRVTGAQIRWDKHDPRWQTEFTGRIVTGGLA